MYTHTNTRISLSYSLSSHMHAYILSLSPFRLFDAIVILTKCLNTELHAAVCFVAATLSDSGHSELLYKNMLTGEADNNQLCCCCCSNPKHLTMSIVNYCCTRTWSCGRLAWTRRPCSTLMSMTARLLTASTSVKPQVRPLPFCRLWMSNGNQCFGCCW